MAWTAVAGKPAAVSILTFAEGSSRRALAGFATLGASVVGDIAQRAAKARGQVGRFQDRVVLVLTRAVVHSTVALVQRLAVDPLSCAVGAHDGSSIQGPSDLHLRPLHGPRFDAGLLPPTALGH